MRIKTNFFLKVILVVAEGEFPTFAVWGPIYSQILNFVVQIEKSELKLILGVNQIRHVAETLVVTGEQIFSDPFFMVALGFASELFQ